jgi:hypothetical protein
MTSPESCPASLPSSPPSPERPSRYAVQDLVTRLVLGAEVLDGLVAHEPDGAGKAWLRLARDRVHLAAQDLYAWAGLAGVPLHLPREPWTAGVHHSPNAGTPAGG